ncbi:hypothetical protein HHK36_011719 [Tetracentron sinense]|uniref:Protein kinase domain-containing protein n=1 Tax=Tetracentron sinense TaxID=13715 RepID=A0A834ZDE5_TETSI|nr:hypothetical protein HHK36_011719 [Tetracentron sinense]
MQVLLLWLIILLLWLEAATASQSKPNCPEKCGSIDVPYPFGFGDSGCFLETGFELSCNYSVSPPMLLTGNISILNISLEQGTVTVNTYMAYNCYKSDNLSDYYHHSVGLIDSIFTFSDTRNMFTAIGCDTLAYISDSNTGLLTNVCASLCSSSEDVTPDSSCSGVGCCKTPIPKGQKKLSMSLLSINGHTITWQFNPCSYAFLADKDWFNFSNIHLFYLPDRMLYSQTVLDWAVGLETCESAQTSTDYACGFNSVCIGAVFLLLIAGSSWWLHRLWKIRKQIKLREHFFMRNGGLILQQQISSNQVGVKPKIFNSEELEMATDNYSETRVLVKGGAGTVYKGMLQNGCIVAIKKSMTVEESQLAQFINEVALLSQVDHRNVVKLLGCCLETEVPLLVYEFVSNGTLFDHIHDMRDDASLMPWEDRLRIAIEIAGDLAYLHSAASVPIFHRDIKSRNILLDENYRAKIADFGISRSVPEERSHLTTMLKGTPGYLDPEYPESHQFTDKSDVYSFGVVLVELLTG